MYDLKEYSDNCKEIRAVNNNGNIVDFDGTIETNSSKFKTIKTSQTEDNGRIDNIEIVVPLKHVRNFWITLEMLLINCEVELTLAWSANCVIIYIDVANQNPTCTIRETNLYAPVVTLSTQDNA